MDAFIQSIMDTLEISGTVPSIVEDKCQEAYRRIRETQVRPAIRKRHLIAKICLPIAACFALVLGIGLANPALAEQLPLVKDVIEPIKNVFSLFHDNRIPTKDPLLHGDQADYAQQVVMNSESTDSSQIKIKIEQIYCDGYNLNISYSAEIADTTLNQYEEFNFWKETDKLNGQEIQQRTALRFQKNQDGNYAAVQQYDISKMTNLTDTFEISVVLSDLRGSDRPISGTWNFDFQGKVNRSGNRIYTINKTVNDMKLDQIILTPSSTIIEYELPIAWADTQNSKWNTVFIPSSVNIADNNGNSPQPSNGYNSTLTDTMLQHTTYGETSPDASSLTVTITVKDKQPAKFIVPLRQ